MLLQLTPDDTKSLEFGTYVYDIQITYSNGDVNTFLDKGTLKLTEEVDGILPPIPAGCQYEMGEWTPEEDTIKGTITFSNTHSEAPFFYLVIRKEESDSFQTYTMYAQSFINYYKLLGHVFWKGVNSSSGNHVYGLVTHSASAGNNDQTAFSNTPLINETGDSAALSNYATASAITPLRSSANFWRASITYKWFAVWMPET